LITELVAFAESEFKLNAPQADKATLREHLVAVWRNTGNQPQQLADAKEVPPAWRPHMGLVFKS